MSGTQLINSIYSATVAGYYLNNNPVMSIIQAGLYDSRVQTTIGMSAEIESYETAALFLTLPFSNKVMLGPNCIQSSGNGINRVGALGVMSGTDGWTWGAVITSYTGSISSNVNGRFVVASINIPQGTTQTSYNSIQMIVDGQAAPNIPLITAEGGPLGLPTGRTFIYDTGTSSPLGKQHTVQVVFNRAGGGAATISVAWFGGFDMGQTGAQAVLFGAVPRIPENTYTNPQSSEATRLVINAGLQNIASRMQRTYGLPVYFTERASDSTVYMEDSSDSYSIGIQGHKAVARAFYGAILQGGAETGTLPLI